MSSRSKKSVRSINRSEFFDFDTLLHPAGAFTHPLDVVNDPDLTLNEKRAILGSWASDACAVVAAPVLRNAPGDVMDAFRLLDWQLGGYQSPPRYRRVLSNRAPGVSTRGARRPPHSPDGNRQPLD